MTEEPAIKLYALSVAAMHTSKPPSAIETVAASQDSVNHKAIAVLRALRNRDESEQRMVWVTLEETLSLLHRQV